MSDFRSPLNILRTNWYNLFKFYICIHIVKIYIKIVTHHVWHTVLWPLIDVRISFLLKILRPDEQNFTKFYASILTSPKLGLIPVIYCSFVTELWPWLMSECRFYSISSKQTDIIWSNFVYDLICTRSWLWLLSVNFLKKKSYGPWMISKFRVRLISWEQTDTMSLNCIYAFELARSRLGVFPVFCLPILWQSYGLWLMFIAWKHYSSAIVRFSDNSSLLSPPTH